MTTKTQTVAISSAEYTKISIGLTGVMTNRDASSAVMVEADSKPDVAEAGDPMLYGDRLSYSLEGENAVWAKTTVGAGSVGVTPHDS